MVEAAMQALTRHFSAPLSKIDFQMHRMTGSNLRLVITDCQPAAAPTEAVASVTFITPDKHWYGYLHETGVTPTEHVPYDESALFEACEFTLSEHHTRVDGFGPGVYASGSHRLHDQSDALARFPADHGQMGVLQVVQPGLAGTTEHGGHPRGADPSHGRPLDTQQCHCGRCAIRYRVLQRPEHLMIGIKAISTYLPDGRGRQSGARARARLDAGSDTDADRV